MSVPPFPAVAPAGVTAPEVGGDMADPTASELTAALPTDQPSRRRVAQQILRQLQRDAVATSRGESSS